MRGEYYIRKTCYKAVLLDPEFLDACYRFYNFTCVWLVRTAMGGTGNRPNILPLATPPKSFSALLESIFEDVIEFLLFYFTHYPRIDKAVGFFDDIMAFLVTFISSSEFVKNPYLRGRFIEVLGLFTPRQLKTLGLATLRFDPFESSTLAQHFLGPSLIRFYVDVEITGASTQFYDKFNARFYVSLVMRHIWPLKSYRESFSNAFADSNLFLGFTNMLINDSIYLLDESFSKLMKIRKNEELMASPEWSTTPVLRQREIEQDHQAIERTVKIYLLLGRETTRMLHYITRDFAKHFMRPELRDRLAAMLNYFLVQLAGPNHQSLRVKNLEKYNFKPKWLLKKIATTYLNFVGFEEFPSAVAKDGRSFNFQIFEDAGKLLQRTKTIPDETYSKYSAFINRAKEEAKSQERLNEKLEDAPDRFLDPILQTLMTDPVKLPTSNVTVDRVTITRHLLSTPLDPFNRAPLSIDQLIPDVELKAEIDKWLSSK
jgi:ubiquitin conjugation factor E4 B